MPVVHLDCNGGKAIGRKALGEVASIVTPETILRSHRELVARKGSCQKNFTIWNPERSRLAALLVS